MRGVRRAAQAVLLGILSAAAAEAGALRGRGGGMTPKIDFDREHSAAVITVPGVPGLRCDVWCYEDGLGKAAESRKDGEDLVLVHRNPKVVGVTVTTVFSPSPGGVDQVVTVEGPSASAVRAINAVNPCVQFQHASSFGRDPARKLGYVDDFVARCFIFLEGGLTLLKDTKRIPGTLPPDDGNAPRVNCENPWIQEYVPAWEKNHWAGQKGLRGFSADRPVYPIIGTVSRDEEYLVAIAWPETGRLGQVWMPCIHPRPCILTAHKPREKRIVSRGKLYLMPNDGKALIAAFERDFPGWRALAERPTKWQ